MEVEDALNQAMQRLAQAVHEVTVKSFSNRMAHVEREVGGPSLAIGTSPARSPPDDNAATREMHRAERLTGDTEDAFEELNEPEYEERTVDPGLAFAAPTTNKVPSEETVANLWRDRYAEHQTARENSPARSPSRATEIHHATAPPVHPQRQRHWEELERPTAPALLTRVWNYLRSRVARNK